MKILNYTIAVTREDVHNGELYIQDYKITPEDMNAAITKAENSRLGSSTSYMTTLQDEVVGHATGLGSCNLGRYTISKHVTFTGV